MAGRELLEVEFALVIHANICGCSSAMATHDLGRSSIEAAKCALSDPALIRRMAEGVGFEVKEKPARYAVREDSAEVFVLDLVRDPGCREHTISRKEPDPELARRHCQQIADELNSKERGQ